jgi:Protein of unknown function (DUF5672)
METMEPRAAVVIPHYREHLTDDERLSFAQWRKHLAGYPTFVAMPRALLMRAALPLEFAEAGLAAIDYPDHYFDNHRRAYNSLLVSRGFYEPFADFTHLLVYQLDALVFADRLPEFLAGRYDYIGAPHGPPAPMAAGNGGFSLRRLAAIDAVLEGRARWMDPDAYWHEWQMNEDLFWSFRARDFVPRFRVAALRDALRFSWETQPRLCYWLAGGALPMGCHAWARYEPELWQALGVI